MITLSAPVTVEMQIASVHNVWLVEDLREVLTQLGKYVGEIDVSGWEEVPVASRISLLETLDNSQIPYHLLFDGKPQESLVFLDALRRCRYCVALQVRLKPSCVCGQESDNKFVSDALSFTEEALAVGLEVKVGITLQKQVCARLRSCVEEALDLGVSEVIFYRCTTPGDDNPSEMELKAAIWELRELRRLSYSVSLGTCLPNCFVEVESDGCQGGITSAFINSYGLVYPCRCATKSAGNILQHKLSELWSHESMEEWRLAIPEPCHGCARAGVCAGGCRACGVQHPNGCDPLIGQPLAGCVEELHEVVLEEDLVPIPRYKARPEPFGWALILGRRVIPVDRQAEPILRLCDGQHSLSTIAERCGSAALSFLYTLYVRGFIELREYETGE